MVLHSGDLDYRSHAELWDAQIDLYFGKNFPYFYAPGIPALTQQSFMLQCGSFEVLGFPEVELSTCEPWE